MLLLLSFIGLFLLSTFTLVTPSVSLASDNNSTMSPSGEQESSIRIFQQDMFNLNRNLTSDLIAQDYVLSLEISGNYTFDTSDKKLTIDNKSFTGTLFGIENLAAMHEPQIQMKLDNIYNVTVSDDFEMLNYNANFVDQNRNNNLTARVAGTLQLQNPIAFDKVIDRQDAILDRSIMNIKIGTTLLYPTMSSPGIEINLISIS